MVDRRTFALYARPLLLLSAFAAACSRPSGQPRSSASLDSVMRDSVRKLLSKGESLAPSATPDNDYTQSNLPSWAYAILRDGGYLRRYRLFLNINPFYEAGLFDGDSLVDEAVQIIDGSSGKRGLAIVHRADSSVHILGAGTSFGNGGDDFSWLFQWFVEDASALAQPSMRGRQALYVGKGDSAGGMIWWDGRRYVWTQWGD